MSAFTTVASVNPSWLRFLQQQLRKKWVQKRDDTNTYIVQSLLIFSAKLKTSKTNKSIT